MYETAESRCTDTLLKQPGTILYYVVHWLRLSRLLAFYVKIGIAWSLNVAND